MKRTWLTAVVPIALAVTSLLVAAASQRDCLGQPVVERDANHGFTGESANGSKAVGCDAAVRGELLDNVAFDRETYPAALPTSSLPPEYIPFLVGLASLAFVPRLVSEAKPLIRRKPP